MIEEAIFSILSNNATVAALIRDRIYPDEVPQQVAGSPSMLPCVVYELETAERSERMCDTDGTVRASIRTDCIALSRFDANEVAKAVRLALSRYQGTPAAVRGHTCPVIKSITLDDEFNIGDPLPGRLRRALYWIVWYHEDSES